MAKSDSPYSTGFASGKIDFNLDTAQQMRQYDVEEKETHSAPNTLPYEMGDLPMYFGNMVDNGIQASKTLEVLLKTKDYDNKKDLIKLKTNLDKMVMYLIQNVDPTLDKFTIGSKNKSD